MNERIMNTKLQEKYSIKILPAPGVGLGAISVDTFREKSPLAEEMIHETREIIQSGECIMTCNHNDDGCVDGRCVDEIAVPNNESFNLKIVESNFGNERAKVAGGGYMTGLAMFKAIGEDLVSPDVDLEFLSKEFARQGVYCGAHTGSHGSEPKQTTDCGANDRFDQILDIAASHRAEVAEITSALVQPFVDTFHPELLKEDLDNWQHIVKETDNFSHSSGISRLDVIRDGILSAQDSVKGEEKVSVIKHLGGNHNEIFLVVNYLKDMTFSQTKLRNELIEKFPSADPESLPQVFALDMWRVDELAHTVAALPEKNLGRERNSATLHKRYVSALLAGTAYQVATYVALTNGSLPVVIVS